MQRARITQANAAQDGSAVSVKLRCAPEAAGYCVRFMYTRRRLKARLGLSETSDSL